MSGRVKRVLRFGALLPLLLLAASVYRPVPELGMGSGFVGDPPGRSAREPFRSAAPRVFIVYLNGSVAEGKPDPCSRLALPPVAADLDGRMVDGYRLTVFQYCTPTKTGGFNQEDGDGVAKVRRRAADTESLLLRMMADGVSSDHIVLMGQSAGAWAGLLIQAQGRVPVAGLIGFAPAFAGRRAYRGAAWQAERDRQIAEITASDRLDGLIFGFSGDPFEPPDAMTWLAARPGIAYRHSPCIVARPHAAAFSPCFQATEAGRIFAYIAMRLRAGAVNRSERQ
ncbi:hypothetical protein HH303_12860 [Rhodospirillaceae bacterium KN72]|uniref:Alpha/beta hydrolase n=1 Tax=Pacificispira spongiicola TaxID=2729598 RepID=A0A7Y0E176_9PROT|nr:hypothetical protein [Pacificispira spongiicola]NMM45377.1 hypothetical protein [Pacificispira spongiicola]